MSSEAMAIAHIPRINDLDVIRPIARRQHLSAPFGALDPVSVSAAGIPGPDDALGAKHCAAVAKDFPNDVLARGLARSIDLVSDFLNVAS